MCTQHCAPTVAGRARVHGVAGSGAVNGISGDGETVNGLGVSIVGTVLWCALIVAAGWVQFVRGDHK